ncbi:MAG: transmembrane anchor protein [Alphaproteobacteria bacterium]|nr:MAG: transmembrane anchor protein [Alphaproteobacteria bacterium]
MHNVNIPSALELPSTGKLIKSTIAAAVAAGVILVSVVMPAEYGIDPTGMGKILGLQKMGEIKTSLAKEAAAELAKDTALNDAPAITAEKTADIGAILTHEMTVTLAANESTEIKLKMNKDSQVRYSWATDQGAVFFDKHADSADIDYHIYNKGTDQKKEGTLTAAFDGSHGWYWKNRTAEPMTITLKTTGKYFNIQEMN